MRETVREGCLTQPVGMPELAALVPGTMAKHPRHHWTLVSGDAAGEDLLVRMHPAALPDRVATVQVYAGGEVLSFTFAGHIGTDFAYDDADRVEVLAERIDPAAAATLGPTCVVLERCRELTLRSTLVMDPNGVSRREDAVVSWPLRRLKGRVTRGRISRQVIDFPFVESS